MEALVTSLIALVGALSQFVALERDGMVAHTASGDIYTPATTTIFWVGEEPGPDNDFISNRVSAWDSNWEAHFGGEDDPSCRVGYHPCGFTPQENPFYVALPYNSFSPEGVEKASARSVPWYEEAQREGRTLLKNRWVEVVQGKNSCYGQWQDAGPGEYDDFAYVFGDSTEPENTFGVGAGLDVSPALRDCLEMEGNAVTKWRFVSAEEVPSGPWTEIVTTRGVTWQ